MGGLLFLCLWVCVPSPPGGGWLVVLVLSVPGWGSCGLACGVGRFPATLGGVFGRCFLFFLALVWCQFCWIGVLVVDVRESVVMSGVFSGVLVGAVGPGRGAVLAWR